MLTWLPDSEMNAEVCYDFHGLLQHSSLQYMCSCCHTKCVIGIDSMCSQLCTRLRLASPFRYKTWARVPVYSCRFADSMRSRVLCSSRFGFTCAACHVVPFGTQWSRMHTHNHTLYGHRKSQQSDTFAHKSGSRYRLRT